MSREKTRAAVAVSHRSRTTARAITIPAPPAIPLHQAQCDEKANVAREGEASDVTA